jgi:hypothetical protein
LRLRLAFAIVFFPLFRAGLPSVIAMSSPGFFRLRWRIEVLRRAVDLRLRGGFERLEAALVRRLCEEFALRFREPLSEAFAAARWRALPKWSFCLSVIRLATFFRTFLLPRFLAGFAIIVSICARAI